MKNLRRLAVFILLVTLCLPTAIVFAAEPLDYSSVSPNEDDKETVTYLDGSRINIKSIVVDKDNKNYYPIKEVVKLFKGTKKEFNFKFDLKKNTLIFYPGASYNKKDTEVTIKSTPQEILENKSAGDGPNAAFAFNRKTKVYVNKKKINAIVYVYQGALYMKLEDVAKAVNCGVYYNKSGTRIEIKIKQNYNGIEPFIADLSKIKTEVKLGSASTVSIKDTTGVIKPFLEGAELVKNPKTEEDFYKLIKYMVINNIMTCTVSTNLPADEIGVPAYANDLPIEGTVYTNAINGGYDALDDIDYGVIKYANVSVVYGSKCKLQITLEGHYDESAKELAKKNKQYMTKCINAIQGLIDEGQISSDMTETEKAKAIYTWVAKHVVYDWEAYLDLKVRPQNQLESALFDQLAVCDGYARLYVFMCRFIGLYDTEYFVGEADGMLGRDAHAWSLQVLDGKKVMTDPTWGDGGRSQESGQDIIDYDWFARPLSYFKANNHYWK